MAKNGKRKKKQHKEDLNLYHVDCNQYTITTAPNIFLGMALTIIGHNGCFATEPPKLYGPHAPGVGFTHPKTKLGLLLCICHQLFSSGTPTRSSDLIPPLFLIVCCCAF